MKPLQFLFFITTVLIPFASCNDKKINTNNELQEQKEAEPTNINHKFFENYLDESLRRKHIDSVIKRGDTTAYKNFYIDYSYSGHSNEFLYYALIMANQYNYPRAYFDIYKHLHVVEERDSVVLTSELKKIKYYYLLKSYQLGYKSAQYYIEEEFGEGYDSAKLMKRLEEMAN